MIRHWLVLLLAALPLGLIEAGSVRDTAIVDLTFDEKSGAAVDTAPGGHVTNTGQLTGGARRVPSPFPNETGSRALLLEASRKQLVRISSSQDTSRPGAATVAFLFVNLHGPADAAMHGLVAKRSTDKTGRTNYGINFQPKSDLLQLYVNDGSGFRTIMFSAKSTLGTRRRIHLVASFAVGDAPGADKDTDADDIRIRLFINGKPVASTKQSKPALAVGADTWLLDIKPAGLVNTDAVTIGASTPTIEHTSGVFDEFQLFGHELTAEESGRLFTEVVGTDGGKRIAQDQKPVAGLPAVPSISNLSLRGLQIGKSTRLSISGKNLAAAATLLSSIPGLTSRVVAGSNAGLLTVEVTLTAATTAGLYPLRVLTTGGVSNPLSIAVDRLPQRTIGSTTAAKPAAIPVALSGLLAGPQIARGHVTARKGQRLVADVESRRLGSGCEPVVEIKNAQGTPLAIEWAKVSLKGDTRAEITVPADGTYTIEVHDLSYKAPGNSPFRIKIGDLSLIDTVFPPAAVAGGEVRVVPVGTGLPANASLTVDLRNAQARTGSLVATPAASGFLGPAPVIQVTQGTEVLEPSKPGTAIDARFSANRHPPLTISGRLSSPGERDQLALDVTPGQKFRLAIAGRSIDSPIDAELSVLVDGKPVASSQDRPGSRDPQLDFTVPAKVTRVVLGIRDLYGRGGSHYLYRLRVSPTGHPNFSLQLQTPQLNLPRVGSALVRLQVNRSGYNGPIALRVVGDDRIRLQPSRVAAGVGGVISVTVSRSAGGDASAARSLSFVGESVGIKPGLRRIARVSSQSIPGHKDLLPVGLTHSSGAALKILSTPVALYRGLPSRITVSARGLAPNDRTGQALRIASISNEPPRPIDPRNRGKGNRPIVRALPNQAIGIGGSPGTISLSVPADVVAGQIELVLRGALVAHGYATAVQGQVYSRPFRLPVRNAASVTLDPKSLTLASNVVNNIRGTLTRDAGFNGAVECEIVIDKRLGAYQAGKVTVAPGQTAFSITVKAGQENEPRVLPNAQLLIRSAGGNPLLPPRIIQLKVNPPKAKAKAKPKAKAKAKK